MNVVIFYLTCYYWLSLYQNQWASEISKFHYSSWLVPSPILRSRCYFYSFFLVLVYFINPEIIKGLSIPVLQRVSRMDLDKLNLVKFADCSLVLGSTQYLLLPQLPQKNDACFKRGQKRLKTTIISLRWSKSSNLESILPNFFSS